MHLDEFLLAAVILLTATAVFVSLFKRLGLGSVLGFLAAGVLVGPSGFAITKDVEGLRHFTELGVALFLFIIGLEMQPKKLWSMRRSVFGLGSSQVLLTGVVIAGYSMLFDTKWQTALILGLGFALSSTAFVLQMLGERGEMATEHGKASFSILLLQDMAIVPMLALVPVLADAPVMTSEQPFWLEMIVVIAVIAAVLLIGRYLIPIALSWTAKNRNKEAFVMIAMLTALGAAFAMELVGVSMALGAFLTGMMLSVSDYRHQIEASVEPFKGLLIGLFFISVGMSIDLRLLVDQWLGVVGGVVALMFLKIVSLLLLGLLFGLGRGVAIRTSFILCQCGEFGFVLFGAAVAGGLLTDAEFAFALMLVTVTMIVTPLMAKAGDALATRFAAKPDGALTAEVPGSELDRHIVVAGYGRGGRIVCLMLEKKGIPFVAYDNDPSRVALGKQQRHNVHYGDITDLNVLDGAGLSHAIGVVITLNDVHHVERVVSTLLNFYPAVPIYARARDFHTEHALLARGVRRAVPEAAESSVQLGKAVLQGIGVADSDLVTILEDFRRDDYALIRPAKTR